MTIEGLRFENALYNFYMFTGIIMYHQIRCICSSPNLYLCEETRKRDATCMPKHRNNNVCCSVTVEESERVGVADRVREALTFTVSDFLVKIVLGVFEERGIAAVGGGDMALGDSDGVGATELWLIGVDDTCKT